MARNFAQVDIGNVELILSLMGSENKKVVFRAVETILALLKNEECIDFCVRYGAISALSQCVRGRDVDIKRVSLQIVNRMLRYPSVRATVQRQLVDTNSLQACL